MKPSLLKLLVTCTAIIFLFVMLRFIIVVRNINCVVSHANTTCPDSVIALLQSMRNEPLLFSDLQSMAEKTVSAEPFTIAGITRQLPDTLIIELLPAEYEFGLQTKDRAFTVTTTGTVLERPIPSDVPSLQVADELILSTEMPSKNQVSVAETIFSTLTTLQLPHGPIVYASEHELRIELQDKAITVIVDPANAEQQIKTVPLILNSPQLQAITEQVVELDMRFKLPVIRTAQPTE